MQSTIRAALLLVPLAFAAILSGFLQVAPSPELVVAASRRIDPWAAMLAEHGPDAVLVYWLVHHLIKTHREGLDAIVGALERMDDRLRRLERLERTTAPGELRRP